MAEFGKAAQVGLMVVALGGAAIFAFRFVSPTAGTSGGYTVHAYLPDVMGVAPHSRVNIQGIQSGVVDRIWLDQGRARIDVKMKPEVKLYDDAVIGKRASSLIGESFIALIPGTEGHRELKDGDEVTHILDEPGIQTLENQVSEILKDVKTVTESLRGSVGTKSGQDDIAAILRNLAEVTESLNQTVKENRQAVKDSLASIQVITRESQPKIDAILVNVKTITDEVRRATAAADAPGQDGKPGDVKSALERINRASASLESTLQHADNVAARIDQGKGSIGKLTKDETLVNEVEGVVEDVGEFVGGISRLQTVVGLGTEYNFLANTVKSYVQLRLQPAEDKYYLIELVNDPRGKTSVEQTDVDTTNPAYPPHYRETRTTTTNAFRFSFQFAKRMGPFTGRFGIKESTGGLGLDLHLLNNRFELHNDVFGFGEELTPRWRVALAYEFIRKLWLVGGVDDIFSHDRRDYFVGLQLRFTDQDLKTVLPFATLPK